jgi:hypothetical protein
MAYLFFFNNSQDYWGREKQEVTIQRLITQTQNSMEGVFDISPSCRNFKNPAVYLYRFPQLHAPSGSTPSKLSLSLSQKEAFKKFLQGRLLHQASSILAFFFLLLHHNLFSRLRFVSLSLRLTFISLRYLFKFRSYFEYRALIDFVIIITP